MRKNIIRYIANKKCPFCEKIHDGWMLELSRDFVELRRERIENTCSCSREKVLEKVKDKCCVCGKPTSRKIETDDNKVERFETYGNWCRKCNGIASAIAK